MKTTLKPPMINWLNHYISTTPKEQIQKEWEEIEKLNFEAPKVSEYFEFIKKQYLLEEKANCIPLPKNIFFNELNPEYSGFLFCKN